MPMSELWKRAKPGWRSEADMQRAEARRAEANVKRGGMSVPEAGACAPTTRSPVMIRGFVASPSHPLHGADAEQVEALAEHAAGEVREREAAGPLRPLGLEHRQRVVEG